jgi:hypothetical protein
MGCNPVYSGDEMAKAKGLLEQKVDGPAEPWGRCHPYFSNFLLYNCD